MFLGEYHTQIGDKNRIAIPKKLRDELDGKAIITRGYERSLLLVDVARWANLIDVINKKPLLSMNVRDTKRYLLGGAIEFDYDNQGRFVLQEELIKFAKLEEDIVFLGVGEWIEVWSKEIWNNRLEVLANRAGEIADRLSETENET